VIFRLKYLTMKVASIEEKAEELVEGLERGEEKLNEAELEARTRCLEERIKRWRRECLDFGRRLRLPNDADDVGGSDSAGVRSGVDTEEDTTIADRLEKTQGRSKAATFLSAWTEVQDQLDEHRRLIIQAQAPRPNEPDVRCQIGKNH